MSVLIGQEIRFDTDPRIVMTAQDSEMVAQGARGVPVSSCHTTSEAPAFPSGDFPGHEPTRGLTKREYFIARAMQGLCAQGIPGSHNLPKNIARTAVEVADETLALLTDETVTGDRK